MIWNKRIEQKENKLGIYRMGSGQIVNAFVRHSRMLRHFLEGGEGGFKLFKQETAR